MSKVLERPEAAMPAVVVKRNRGVAGLIWSAAHHFQKDDGFTLAGSIAYATIFAFFPFITFLLTVAGLIGQTEAAGRSIELGLELLPAQVVAVLGPVINEISDGPRTGLMTVSIALAIYAASSALECLRHAVNRAYETAEPPPIWYRWLESMIMTIFLALVTLAVTVTIVGGPLLWKIAEFMHREPITSGLTLEAIRYSTGVLLLLGVLVFLYGWLPGKRRPVSDIAPGALVAVTLWMVAAGLFTYYLTSLGHYSVTYGSLGGVVITLLFFYVSAVIFIFGAELNGAILRRRRGTDLVRPR